MTEHTFTAADGASLFYRAWLPSRPTSRAVLLFHRGHEHSGRWAKFVDALDLPDVAVFAWDQRGHGQSDGERGCAPDFGVLTRDADAFARHLVATHGVRMADTVVIAASLGAVLATAWVHDYAPPVRALVLAAAAFQVKLYLPLAIPALRAKERLRPGGFVKSFVKSRLLTADPAEQRAYDADPLIFRQISVSLLLDLHHAGRRLVDDAAVITTPTLVLVAGRDWVVRERPQFDFFRRLGSTMKRLEMFPAGKHALFHDAVAPDVTRVVRTFVIERFADEAPPATDVGHVTRAEYDLLRTPSNVAWRAVRQVVRIGGWFSSGIRLGHAIGFDSGESLDYVYADQAAGRSPLGRLIDRNYLNAIGWRGIRVRRRHLRALLHAAIDRLRVESRAIHILDIAAGPGRYVLETIAERMGDGGAVTAELRDCRQGNLDAAARLADRLGVPGVVFRRADAFDRAAVASAAPKPTIAIVSGLYELLPENDLVRRSLAGLADAVEAGGYLLYTGQPWHPQVEFIARTLTNRDGHAWVMRRRSQAELDALVAEAGFEKVDQCIDRWGIFTVALARRARS